MDPVTFIGLLSSVGSLIESSHSFIKLVRSFLDGDEELHELLGTVLVFAEALKGFDRVLRSRQTVKLIDESVIQNALENAEKIINDLEERLLRILKSEVLTMRRLKWIQHKSEFKKLHERLKEQNSMLQAFLALTHAETFLAVASHYPQFMMMSSSADDTTEGPRRKSDTLQVPAFDSAQSNSSRRRLSSSSSIATVESSTFSMETLSVVSSASSYAASISSHRRSSSDLASFPQGGVSPASKMSSEAVMDFSKPMQASNKLSILHQDTTVVRRACHYNCFCKCHETAKNARKSLQKHKNAKINCTDATCRNVMNFEEKSAAQSSSFRQAMLKVMSSKSVKIRYDLNTYRMIPEGSDAMRHVKHGNLEKLKACIDSGEATLWDTAPDGWSLLHTAAYNRHLPIVKYLLELGAETEIGDVGSRRPSDLALFKSLGGDATQEEHDIVALFSQRDDCISDFEFTPIHIAALEIYDVTDREHPSLEDLIQVLDDANNAPIGTDWTVWKSRYKSRSPLFSAVIEYFRASAYEQPKGGKIIHNLLDQRDKKNCWTPLHWVASAGRADKMRILVEHGANPFLLSNLNANIIHAAAESKIDHGLKGALEIWKRYPRQLNINQANRRAETPLHVAAWCSAACVKSLLEAGADPDVQQEDGQVPLHCAGLSGAGPDRREIVSLLCGAESTKHINTQDVDGRPPIFDFLDDSECVEILFNHGARLELPDNVGRTLFHHACIQDESHALRTVLDLGVDLGTATMKDRGGNTPLIEALSHGSTDCAMILLELDDVGDIVGKDGWAAAHYAAKIGDTEVLEAVLKHPSFEKGMKTPDGKTVDTVAMEAGTWCGRVKGLVRKYNSLD